MLYVINLPNVKFKHLITFNTAFINQFHSRFNSSGGDTILKSLSFGRSSSIGKRVWEWKIFWKESKLTENGRLVPRNMFVIKTVTSDIDHGCKWYSAVFASWWNTRNPRETLAYLDS